MVSFVQKLYAASAPSMRTIIIESHFFFFACIVLRGYVFCLNLLLIQDRIRLKIIADVHLLEVGILKCDLECVHGVHFLVKVSCIWHVALETVLIWFIRNNRKWMSYYKVSLNLINNTCMNFCDFCVIIFYNWWCTIYFFISSQVKLSKIKWSFHWTNPIFINRSLNTHFSS